MRKTRVCLKCACYFSSDRSVDLVCVPCEVKHYKTEGWQDRVTNYNKNPYSANYSKSKPKVSNAAFLAEAKKKDAQLRLVKRELEQAKLKLQAQEEKNTVKTEPEPVRKIRFHD